MDKSQNGRPSIPPRRGIFDVVRPGRTPASPTSRPFVSNQKPVQDTSVTVGPPAVPRGLMNATQTQQQALVSPVQNTPIQSAPVQPTLPPQQPVVAQPVQSSAPAVVQPPPAMHHQQPAQTQHDVGEAAVIGQVTAPQVVDEHHQMYDGHPVHSQHHSILSEVLAIVAIVLLVAVIINILVDADVLDLPIPHTNFFDY